MLREAQAEGMLTIAEREARIMGEAGGNYVKPDHAGEIHDELRHWNWWPAQLFPKRRWERRIVNEKEVWQQRRRIDLSGRRNIPKGACIHESAFDRGQDYVAKLPSGAIRVQTLKAPEKSAKKSTRRSA
jgi:hypothetical protein